MLGTLAGATTGITTTGTTTAFYYNLYTYNHEINKHVRYCSYSHSTQPFGIMAS